MATRVKVREHKGDKDREIWGILLIFASLILFLFLVTYGLQDQTTGKKVIGRVGEGVSFYLVNFGFGYWMSFVIPLLLFYWGLQRLRKGMVKRTLVVSGGLLVLAGSVSVSLAIFRQYKGFTESWETNGLLGSFFADQLLKYFGYLGSCLVLAALLVMVVTQTFRLPLSGLFAAIGSFLTEMRYRYRLNARIRREERVKKKSLRALAKKERVARKRKRRAEKAAVIEGLEEGGVEKGKKVDEKIATEPMPSPELEGISVSEGVGGPGQYIFPPLDLLKSPSRADTGVTTEEMDENAAIIETKLGDFGVEARVVRVSPGPVVTRFEVEPAPGVKVSRIVSLADDLALAMRAKRIRIVAPIPGHAAVGIEIPNRHPETVYLREIIGSPEFQGLKSLLSFAVGKTISGDIYCADLKQMPHLLIAGATGSGKSVCIHAIIASILYRARPDEVQFVMIDPKRLELTSYSKLKNHHLTVRDDLEEGVVTHYKNAVKILQSVEGQMAKRYRLLSAAGVRNIDEYNQAIDSGRELPAVEGIDHHRLVYLVIIVDELADLMLVAAKSIEEPITRLAQMSRAVGIHLILATQRPSVDVITGVIKANFPTRMAFQVASKVDSRTILDLNGAEKLLGKGDMLFLPPGQPEPIRIHSALITSEEIDRIISHVIAQPTDFDKLILGEKEGEEKVGMIGEVGQDELFEEAKGLVIRHQQGSISLLQRRLKIGYARAARLIDELEAAGVVGPFDGSKAREVLVGPDSLE
ncbi:DNA translocase FtsK 4TM domain-containing protein [candidate division KSB1 bacterium]|nr:DNA translocase FtsK 4TM domain-containing protein [candidate division KSB1 bacterium]